jgi:hypothetical protein
MTNIAGGLSVDLFEAFKSLPLGRIAIVPASDLKVTPHLVVGLLKTDTGIVVAPPGWSENAASVPFRAFAGTVTGEGPWKIGEAVLRVVEDGDFLASDYSEFIARPAGIDDAGKVIVQLENFAQEMKLAPWMLPAITDKCGSHLTYRDFIECAETWRRLRIDNVPRRPATYVAMRDLCANVLDPVIDHFGPIELTYGFASAALSKLVQNVTLDADQHVGCELNRSGRPFCRRLGQSVDFRVPKRGSLEVAHWVVENTAFDRLYFYADDRPFHVSFGPEHTRLRHRLPKLPTVKSAPPRVTAK